MISPRTCRRRLVAAGLAGGLLGAATSMSNHGHGQAPAYASQLLDAPWTWVFVSLLTGFAARRWVQSALLSVVTFWAAVLCYDLTDLRLGVYTGLGSSGRGRGRPTG